MSELIYGSYGKKSTSDYAALGIPCRKRSGIKMFFPGPEQFLKIPPVKSSLSFLILEYALNLNGTCSHLVILRQFFQNAVCF